MSQQTINDPAKRDVQEKPKESRFTKPVYKPEEWRDQYRQDPLFDKSVSQVERIKGLPRDDAESELMDILLKATCVECCLQLNGIQKLAELYKTVETFTENKANPFASVSELEEFLAEMDLLFFLHPRRKEYNNTGTGYRKFVQMIVSQGREVARRNLRSTLEDHYNRCGVGVTEGPHEHGYIQFLKKEVLADFESLKLLSTHVKGFCYDSTTEVLTLSESAATRLVLHVPIFQKLISTGAMDLSRVITGVGRVTWRLNGCENGVVTQGVLAGASYNFRKNFLRICLDRSLNDTTPGFELWFKAVLCPNNRLGVLEVFETIPHVSYLSDSFFSSGTVSLFNVPKLRNTYIGFEAIDEAIQYRQQQGMFRVDPQLLFQENLDPIVNKIKEARKLKLSLNPPLPPNPDSRRHRRYRQ